MLTPRDPRLLAMACEPRLWLRPGLQSRGRLGSCKRISGHKADCGSVMILPPRGAPAARAVRETRSFPAPIQHFPRVSPDEAKMKLNIPSLPSSTFAPYRGRLFYSCNARNPGEQQEEERRRLPTGNGSTNAAGNNILPCERAAGERRATTTTTER